MITVQEYNPVQPPDHLRPFDARRDLSQVADLVEQCFSDSLDPDGQNYIQQMRHAARNPGYLSWVGMGERTPVPLGGYVWDEGGRIVGNLTLIPYYPHGKLYYLIANVAVNPDYRRKGIARGLTRQAIEHAKKSGASYAWLHVREENLGAVSLYRSLGFEEHTRRTTWSIQADRQSKVKDPAEDFTRPGKKYFISARRTGDWPIQKDWLEMLYPRELNWHLSLNMRCMQPGLWSAVYRFMTDTPVKHWSFRSKARLLGVLSWNRSNTYADNLWLATTPEADSDVAFHLLSYAQRKLPTRRSLSLDFPAGQAVNAIQAAGFVHRQTLLWMSMPLKT
jgi:ribosomal protein S18 acetylase RimI-like enzyme